MPDFEIKPIQGHCAIILNTTPQPGRIGEPHHHLIANVGNVLLLSRSVRRTDPHGEIEVVRVVSNKIDIEIHHQTLQLADPSRELRPGGRTSVPRLPPNQELWSGIRTVWLVLGPLPAKAELFARTRFTGQQTLGVRCAVRPLLIPRVVDRYRVRSDDGFPLPRYARHGLLQRPIAARPIAARPIAARPIAARPSADRGGR